MNDKKQAGIERPYTLKEFARVIEKIANETKVPYFDHLDYFDGHTEWNNPNENVVDNEWCSVISRTIYGGNEGIYTDLYLQFPNGEERRFATAKTLGEGDGDYINMHIMAAHLCLIANKYINTHADEFCWKGFDVCYEKDGNRFTYCWCHTIENAKKNVAELKERNDITKVLVRNNATKEITEY